MIDLVSKEICERALIIDLDNITYKVKCSQLKKKKPLLKFFNQLTS